MYRIQNEDRYIREYRIFVAALLCAVRPESPVAWDERFRDVLQVFVTPSAEREAEFQAQAQSILDSEKQKERADQQE